MSIPNLTKCRANLSASGTIDGDRSTSRGPYVFLLYASADRERAFRVADLLESNGLPVMGATDYDAAWAEGRTMSQKRAIKPASDTSDPQGMEFGRR